MAESSYFSNGIVRGRENNEYRCFLCTNEGISQDWQRHIEDPQHVSAIRQFRLIFSVSEESIDCKACNASVDWEGLKNHAKWHRIVPWYEIENKDKIFFENRVLNVKSSFICVPCETRFNEWSGAFVHIGEEQHRKLIAHEPPIHETFAPTDSSYEFLIAEGFEPWGSNTVKCRPCLCPNVRLNNLQEHVSQPDHAAAKIRFIADSKYRRAPISTTNAGQNVATDLNRNRGVNIPSNNHNTKSASEKLIAELRSGSFSNLDKIANTLTQQRTNSASRLPKSSSGRDSNRRGKNSHSRRTRSTCRQESNFHPPDSNPRRDSFTPRNGNANSRNGKSNLGNGNSAPRVQKHDWPVETRSHGLYCTICNEVVQTSSNVHMAEERHKRTLERLGHSYVTPIDDYKFWCKCCKVNVPNLENVFRHIRGSKHRENIPAERDRQVKAGESKGEAEVVTKEEPRAATKDEKAKGKTTSFKMNFSRASNPPAVNLPPLLPPNQSRLPPPNHAPGMNITPPALMNNPLRMNFMPQLPYALQTSYLPQPLMNFPIGMNSSSQPTAYLPLTVDCMPHSLMNHAPKFTPENLPRDYIIVQNSNDLFCRICDCIIHGHSNVDEHIKNKSHSHRVEDFCATISPLSDNSYHCKRCNATFNNRNDLYIHLSQHVHRGDRSPVKNSPNFDFPRSSNDSNLESNSSKFNVQDKSLMAENSFARSRLARDFIVILGRLDFCCKICHMVFSDQTKIETHLQEPEHCNAFRKYEQTKTITDGKYVCNCCKCSIPNFANVPPHVFGDQHKSKSPASSSICESSFRELGPHFIVRIGEEDYYCNICHITIITRVNLDQHLKDQMHINCYEKYGCEQIVARSGSSENLHCMCCDYIIPDFDFVYVHLSGRRHLDNVAEKRRGQLARKDDKESVGKAEIPNQVEKPSSAGMERRSEMGLRNAFESVSKESTTMSEVSRSEAEKLIRMMEDEMNGGLANDLKIESQMKRLAMNEESSISRSLASSTMSLNTSARKLRAPRAKKSENAVPIPDDIFEMRDKLRELKNDIELCAASYNREYGPVEFHCMICLEKIGQDSDLYEHFRSYEHCDGLMSKKMAHKDFELVADQFSDYDLAREFLGEESEDLVHCWVCDVKVSNVDEVVRAHIAKKSHTENRDTIREKNRLTFVNELEPKIGCDWYDIQEFHCTLCNTTYVTEFEFIEHAQSSQHVVAVEKIDSTYRALIHDFCSTCSILWYGDRCQFARHEKTLRHEALLGAKTKPETPKLRGNVANLLSDICHNGIEEMSVDSYQLRRKFISDLEATVQQSFPGTKVQVISSNPASAEPARFEVLLNFGVELDDKSEDSVHFLARRVASALSDHPARWHTALINDKSVPLRVTTQHLPSSSRVEIFLNDNVSFTPSKLFNSLRAASVYLDWPIRTVKFMITLYENEFQEFMRPYIEDTMIFFMQSKSLLPKISDLVQFEGRPFFKPDWDIEVNGLESLKQHSGKPLELVMEYHRFYATFDYRREVVCPWIGETVKKRGFADPKNLPKGMNSPSDSHVSRNGEFLTPFCIQNPFGLMENRTKEMSKAQLNGFRKYCSWVVETLERQGASNSD